MRRLFKPRWLSVFNIVHEPFYQQTTRPAIFLTGIAATLGFGIVLRYLLPQPYENFTLRVLLALLVAAGCYVRLNPLMSRRLCGALLYLIWYAVPWFCFTMYLVNGADNIVWATCSICLVYMLFCALQWRTAIILFALSLASAAPGAWLLAGASVLVWSRALAEYLTVLVFVLATSYHLASRSDVLNRAMVSGAGTAIAVLAHEVRSPLFALRAGLFSIQARMAVTDPDCEEFQLLCKLMRRIDDVNGTLNVHIKNLRFSHMTMERRPIEPVSTVTVVRDAVDTLSQLAQDVTIAVEVDDGAALGNLDGIRQVLINLMRNGISAVRSVSAGTVTVRCKRDRDEFVFSVEDTAATLRLADAERIFDPFVSFRSDAGIGVGLYASKLICRAMGATLRVHIEPDRTVFCFNLPVSRRGDAPGVTPPSDS